MFKRNRLSTPNVALGITISIATIGLFFTIMYAYTYVFKTYYIGTADIVRLDTFHLKDGLINRAAANQVTSFGFIQPTAFCLRLLKGVTRLSPIGNSLTGTLKYHDTKFIAYT